MRFPIIGLEALEARSLCATVPTGFIDQTVVNGLKRPTATAILPDGRWLVTEQSGALRVVKNGALISTPAGTLSVDSVGERGLLGVTADPNFAANGHIYLYYTPKTTPKGNHVSRFTLNGDAIVKGSETPLLTLDTLSSATNHNGGAMHFGPDGRLYIAVGENAAPLRAQSLTTVFGKMLRINRDGTIPTDNPFYTQTTGINRAIWALGLRNPFTFSFHPSSGRMHINDVGSRSFEEINVGRAGANYGWPGSEGATADAGTDAPIANYGRDVGRAITGGVFYAGSAEQFPRSYRNDYFFGDYSAGFIKVLDSGTNKVYSFSDDVDRPIDLDVLPDGSLLYTSYAGSIHRVRYAPEAPVSIIIQPADVTVALGQDARFTAEASGDGRIRYQWYRDGVAIRGASGPTYVLAGAKASDDGVQFSLKARTATDARVTRRATLDVDTTNDAPVPTIKTPLAGARFIAGQSVRFTGSAVDEQDGTLSASQLSWTIQYVTGSVRRPFRVFSGVASGTFTIPRITPYTQADVSYRITLIATDALGVQTSVSRVIAPRLSTLGLSTNIPGIPIFLDGQPQTTPARVVGVEGVTRTIEAPSSFVVRQRRYVFVSFSDDGPRSRTLDFPTDDLDLVATYRRKTPS
ncbi:MAG: PQQ-dependent sugar dehydrogenase [Burkholderiales bacterium]|nr:PQQ-dependent sugar dehydrogenase [Phycisphaerae bacterium]